MAPQTLQKLLESIVENIPTGKVISDVLRSLNDFQTGLIVLLHVSDHLSEIIWFWSVLYSGCLPAMSTPFSNKSDHRIRHIEHLSRMLKTTLCITSEGSLEQFSCQEFLRPITIESLERVAHINYSNNPLQEPPPEDTVLLMLTSGSTGNAKAVCLSHSQILAAVAGKSSVLPLPGDTSFLNWIALDHVASMVEIHLQALFLGMDQVHVHPADIVVNPSEFVRLIDEHRVSRTFALNFFLARLRTTLESIEVPQDLDLSCLRYLASGGEANVTETCATVTDLLMKYGAPEKIIVAGFGMAETCAESIFNTNFPAYDIDNGLEFTSVGHCMPGVEMRIASPKNERNSIVGDIVELEVRGRVVFKKYFNNEPATAEAFTKDGWFRTGDRAFIDPSGHLNLMGRNKDTLIVNGVKYDPQEIKFAIEEAGIAGVTNSFTVCFSSPRSGSQTEKVFVVYLPSYNADDTAAHLATFNATNRVVMMQTGIELILLKRNIEEHLDLLSPIPIITLMNYSTIRSLVAALKDSSAAPQYDPAVVLQSQGTKNLCTPSARGFGKGEPYFSDIRDACTTYHASTKCKQPQEPYIMAGYSYGSMLAFEIAKILESNGDEVKFLGVFNLPPHIKSRMRQLNWVECILHLSYFLDLITEKHSRALADDLKFSPKEEVLANVLTSADPRRVAELSLSPIALVNWANLAYALQSMAVDYEPSELVADMDVFYCTPLAVVAASREQWLEEHLSQWKNFARGEVGYHEVGGEHYTMLGKEHVYSFQKMLKRVLRARGL
ncbi:hypothetical protein B0J14DRAFT_630842 [Halenospora varia]|nr:hypothetical protein B0J14DRAFT_630842 [Halenospora varia]